MDSHADKLRRPLDSKPVSPSLFAHFVLRTANREPLQKWYQTVLNARLVFANEYISFITYDDEHHRVAFVQIPNLKKAPDDSWGLAHVAYSFANLGELLSTYRRLKGEGIMPVRTINHGPTVSMYYKDPDGNQVELQVDLFNKEAPPSTFTPEAFINNPNRGACTTPNRMLPRITKPGPPRKRKLVWPRPLKTPPPKGGNQRPLPKNPNFFFLGAPKNSFFKKNPPKIFPLWAPSSHNFWGAPGGGIFFWGKTRP